MEKEHRKDPIWRGPGIIAWGARSGPIYRRDHDISERRIVAWGARSGPIYPRARYAPQERPPKKKGEEKNDQSGAPEGLETG